jgi:metal-sulfur cluster biosynthetic enzyme
MTVSERARAALQAIEIPQAHRSVGDLVEALSIEGRTAHVRMRLLPAYVSKSQLRSWVERALKALPEIEAVHVEFAQTPRQAPRVARPPQKLHFPQIAHIVAIFSGKGGVGKSTVSVNLAVALERLGDPCGALRCRRARAQYPYSPGACGAASRPRRKTHPHLKIRRPRHVHRALGWGRGSAHLARPHDLKSDQ